MKIAISSTGKEMESQVDTRFGRCPYFIIVDIENKKIKGKKIIKNEAMAQRGGAGISAAEVVGNEKVSAVITVNIGPRAVGIIQQLGIKIYQAQGTVKEVIQNFIGGKLKEIKSPTGPRFVGRN